MEVCIEIDQKCIIQLIKSSKFPTFENYNTKWTFDQLNASLLNKSINLYTKSTDIKLFAMNKSNKSNWK